jgi:hypothetical protein
MIHNSTNGKAQGRHAAWPNTANTGQTLKKFTAPSTGTLATRDHGRAQAPGPSGPKVCTTAAAILVPPSIALDQQTRSRVEPLQHGTRNGLSC